MKFLNIRSFYCLLLAYIKIQSDEKYTLYTLYIDILQNYYIINIVQHFINIDWVVRDLWIIF